MSVGALASLAIPGWALCTETDFSLTVGAEYTSGDYGGDQSVDDVYLPVTAPEGTIIEEPGGHPSRAGLRHPGPPHAVTKRYKARLP